MKNLILLIFTATISMVSYSQNELFISEYVEGTGNNTAIELYNPTLSPINLSNGNYSLSRFSNGGTTPFSVNLIGIVPAHGTYVIVRDKRNPNGTGYDTIVDAALLLKADTFICPLYATCKMMYFNGNDAVALFKNNNMIDLIGKIGQNPGQAWTTDATSGYTSVGGAPWWTKNHTLIRKNTITGGVTSNPSSFNPSLQWDSLPCNTFSNLGSHNLYNNNTYATPDVLIIDDDINGSDESSRIDSALFNIGYNYTHINIDTNSPPSFNILNNYDIVIWSTANDGVDLKLWDVSDTATYGIGAIKFNSALMQYINTGKTLWIDGLDFLFDIYGSAPYNFNAGDFCYDVMGIDNYVAQSHLDDSLNTFLGLKEVVKDSNNTFLTLDTIKWIWNELWYADALDPTNTATVLYRMGPPSYDFAGKASMLRKQNIVTSSMRICKIGDGNGNYSQPNIDTLVKNIINNYFYSTTFTINTISCISYISPSGNIWNTSGTYIDTIPNTLGYDSIITINLTINTPSYATISTNSCSSYISPSGKTWVNSGIYMDTISNALGCDSIITINLTINNSTSATLYATSCNSYTSPSGKTWTVSGTYSDTLINTSGCDSIITVNLNINQPYYFIENDTICYGDSLLWQNSYYSTAGQYHSNNTSSTNCDSNYTLNLTVNPLPQLITIITNPTNGILLNGNTGEILTTTSFSGFNYWATKNSVVYSSTIAGTNASLSLGTLFTAGTYEIWTSNAISGCQIKQTNVTFTTNTNYTITASTNPTNGGTVTGAGVFNQGQTCSLVATANTGYVFSNWTENGTQVSTSANYSFTVMGNKTLVANFILTTYNISVTINPNIGGTITGAGVFNSGQTCILTAIPNTNYIFNNWTENNTIISTNAIYSFPVTTNHSIIAIFSSTIGINDSENKQCEIQIYPNPNKGSFTLEINTISNKEQSYNLEVYSAMGILVYKEQLSGNYRITKKMDLEYLSKGVYIIKLKSKDSVINAKFIIE